MAIGYSFRDLKTDKILSGNELFQPINCQVNHVFFISPEINELTYFYIKGFFDNKKFEKGRTQQCHDE